MSIDPRQMIRVGKRLEESTGYLELGLPQRTLDCLEGLGELGPHEAQVALVRAQAYRLQRRFDDAAGSLKIAAQKLPAPADRPIWFASSICYRQAGDTLQSIESLAHARGAWPRRHRASES